MFDKNLEDVSWIRQGIGAIKQGLKNILFISQKLLEVLLPYEPVCPSVVQSVGWSACQISKRGGKLQLLHKCLKAKVPRISGVVIPNRSLSTLSKRFQNLFYELKETIKYGYIISILVPKKYKSAKY